MYSASIFNTQNLLFDRTRPVDSAGQMDVPSSYYQHGWTIIDGVADALEAVATQEEFLQSLDQSRLPLNRAFNAKVQLAKADQIPVCDDIISTSFQVLHFDMGHPFIGTENQLVVTHVGIYLPRTTARTVTARTRLVELNGLLAHLGLSAEEIERRVTSYALKYGDGWVGHNTFRLACFARFIDAISDVHEFSHEIDKTVGQWFQSGQRLDADSAHQQEQRFYARHGIDLRQVEKQIMIEPGQLLILDNARVIHGRVGARSAKELYNFMFGVQSASPNDVAALRAHVCGLVCGSANERFERPRMRHQLETVG